MNRSERREMWRMLDAMRRDELEQWLATIARMLRGRGEE